MLKRILRKLHIIHNIYIKHKFFIKKKSYAMDNEDTAVLDYFKDKKNGFYVDVGCYHPIDGNNTYLLFKKGWEGINIDLNKTSIDLFNRARKNDYNLNVAISNKSKKIKFYYRKKINMLNTINKKFAKSSFLKGFKTGIIKSENLNLILKKSKIKNKKIDFLNLDIEGNEIDALKSLNFRKYKPRLICVEIHINTPGRNTRNNLKNNKIYRFLNKRGYKNIWSNEFSFIFMRK